MSKTFAVMQPTYLPWAGYFDLMDQVDTFVLLDNVEFSRQSWQQRNRIRASDGLLMLTVPVLRTGKSGQEIRDVTINPRADFPRAHLKTLEQNYRKAPHYESLYPEFKTIVEVCAAKGELAHLNASLIGWIRDKLGITTPIVQASNVDAAGERSHRLVNLGKRLGCRNYLTVPGTLDYLKVDRDIFRDAEIEVEVQNFVHPEYPQVYRPFLPFASAVDLLFNVGVERSLEVIRSGRHKSAKLDDAIRNSEVSP